MIKRLIRGPRAVLMLLGSLMLVALGGGAAFADPPADPTGGLYDGAQDAITGTYIPAVVAIVLVGSLFWLGIRWYKKGKNAGSS